MPEPGGHGVGFGRRLGADHVSFFHARTLRETEIAVTEVQAENPEHRLSDSIPREDAFLITLQLRPYPVHEYWEDGRRAPLASLDGGCTTVYDLKRDPVFLINGSFHSVHFYLPRATLDAVADEAETSPIGDFRYTPGAGTDDPVMRALASAVRPALHRPDQFDRLYVSSILLGVATHAARQYGGIAARGGAVPGGLAPWQKRRAQALLEANLGGQVPLARLAGECGLSPSHFARAFRRSFGVPPHQWLVQRRVQSAMRHLRDSALPLAEIAAACGFADQSHFTRVFSARVGVAPGAWRRIVKN